MKKNKGIKQKKDPQKTLIHTDGSMMITRRKEGVDGSGLGLGKNGDEKKLNLCDKHTIQYTENVF